VETARQRPDLFAMEVALSRTWAERGRRVAPRAGRAMRTYVERRVDVANCWSALLVADHGFDGLADPLFLEGGRLLPRDLFLEAAAAPNRGRAAALLDELVRQSPIAAATSHDSGAEDRLRRALWREQHEMARLDPTGPAAIIAFWLRLRGEVETLQRMIWALAAGAPPALRVPAAI
jgi:vacuolar-type H+-ATPase subunit C/Vma6